jgi:hypothetical protein
MENQTPSTKTVLDLSVLGITYIRSQQKSLIGSLIYPLVTIVIQVLNFIFMLNLTRPPPHQNPDLLPPQILQNPPPPLFAFDFLTPIIIFIILAVVALWKVVFVFGLRNKAIAFQEYQHKLTRVNPGDEESGPENYGPSESLTSLFYRLVKYMEWIQRLSLMMYCVFIIYIQWYIRYFLMLFGIIPGALPRLFDVMFWVNLADQIGLIFFLIPDLRQFIHWHRKLSRLRDFEQKISLEFDREFGVGV